MILLTQACLDSQAATRRAFAQMSATNLQDNVRQLQYMVGDAKLIAMVKANGFGHGIRSCALQLESLVSAFGVAHVEEARVLREVGITNTILLMEGVYSADEMALLLVRNAVRHKGIQRPQRCCAVGSETSHQPHASQHLVQYYL